MLQTSATRTSVSTRFPVTGSALRATSYADLYEKQARDRAFNFVLLDKALVQISYEFDRRQLVKHRLAFLPSPSLVEFQNDPEFYLREHLYGDVVGLQSVAVPLRFDFDRTAAADRHPPSHLTIGQYQHCRIPVSGPITPTVFVDFLVRHFYETPAMARLEIDLELDRRFELSQPGFAELVHVASPGHR